MRLLHNKSVFEVKKSSRPVQCGFHVTHGSHRCLAYRSVDFVLASTNSLWRQIRLIDDSVHDFRIICWPHGITLETAEPLHTVAMLLANVHTQTILRRSSINHPFIPSRIHGHVYHCHRHHRHLIRLLRGLTHDQLGVDAVLTWLSKRRGCNGWWE